ncbi:hypothetical protein HJ588_07775 [Flexivirga sp. ID2601S]|uniref:Pyridoxamine 5'-phosphate oxidase family protein n=1 Tax=Flexivirga aerilata TaxID=1656889 RepID=A0A849AIL6_9MICO|nr:hypothetical protein [Flexivirga aerilata]NNG39171.1 hypothetical protein [Flexivirga aerilata]
MSDLSEATAKALAKSKVAWLVLPDEQTVPVWYAAATDAALIVGGPGEQSVPELPPAIRVILRDKDTRAAVGPVDAWPVRLQPGTEPWEDAATALLAARQNNPPGGLREHWAAECTLWSIDLTGPHETDDEAQTVSS